MPRLILYNIGYCQGIQGRLLEYLKFLKVFFPPKDLDKRIIKDLKKYNPDILGLIEIDSGSFRSKKNEINFFSKELSLNNIISNIKYPREGFLKLFHYIPILRKQSNAIISKYKFNNIKHRFFSVGTKRLILECTLNNPKKVTLFLVHLALTKSTRNKQLKELEILINKTKNNVILMGDFNTFHGERELKEFLQNTGLKNYNKSKTHPTFKPKNYLDYILTSKSFKIKSLRALSIVHSDHLPLLLEY